MNEKDLASYKRTRKKLLQQLKELEDDGVDGGDDDGDADRRVARKRKAAGGTRASEGATVSAMMSRW